MTYEPGYLSWGALPAMQRVRPCPLCGDDVRRRSHNEPCAACKASPAYREAQRIKRARWQRTSKARQIQQAPGSPRIVSDTFEFGGAA